MPTSAVVRQAFRDQRRLAQLLERDVLRHMEKKPNEWFFAGRVKQEESFVQKVISGKVRDFAHLEDFYACELVVPLSADIPRVEQFLAKFFDERYRKPVSSDRTNKPSDSFVFDDLRLYGTLRVDESLPPRPIDEVVFEIQVKTFLQHAWAIATHDLVYKYDRASWARSRVAFQVKALLEQAELSINGITELEGSGFLPKLGEPEAGIQEMIEFLSLEFDPALLPRDRRRIATTILDVARQFGYTEIKGIKALFRFGRGRYGGHPVGWGPYECLVDYASLKAPKRVVRALTDVGGSYVIFVTREVVGRLGLPVENLRNAVL